MHKVVLLFILSLAGLCNTYREAKNDSICSMPITNKQSSDTIYFDKNLPVYKASVCLTNLLVAIVKANKQYYSPNKFFYSLTFNKGKSVKYVNISAEQWHASKSLDYSGVIKINYATFLCRGDFATDSLFYKDKLGFLRIKLRQINDSTDIPINIEPSLRGAYQECSGQRISLEIYTQGEIPGYKMTERQSVRPK
jgi:hypothetical protein